MGKMKEIWANPMDYPKELVWRINGGKARWINVRGAAIRYKKKKRKHTETT